MSKRKTDNELLSKVSWSDELTDYDRNHYVVYLRLLDSCAAGASNAEMSRIVLGIDPTNEPRRAKFTLESHLRRAHWMTEHGHRYLLEKRHGDD